MGKDPRSFTPPSRFTRERGPRAPRRRLGACATLPALTDTRDDAGTPVRARVMPVHRESLWSHGPDVHFVLGDDGRSAAEADEERGEVHRVSHERIWAGGDDALSAILLNAHRARSERVREEHPAHEREAQRDEDEPRYQLGEVKAPLSAAAAWPYQLVSTVFVHRRNVFAHDEVLTRPPPEERTLRRLGSMTADSAHANHPIGGARLGEARVPKKRLRPGEHDRPDTPAKVRRPISARTSADRGGFARLSGWIALPCVVGRRRRRVG